MGSSTVSESFSPHEQRLVEAIVDAVTLRMKEEPHHCTMTPERLQEIQRHTAFFVDAKEQYDQYKRISRFMDMVDEASGIARKVLVTAMVGFLVAALGVGLVLKIRTL